jgi:hypothetical protein
MYFKIKNMSVIKPPSPLTKNLKNQPKVFLAGSIEMGAAEDWQKIISNTLSKHYVTIYNPRRDDWDSSWEQKVENPQFYQQVNWELNALENSDIIIMYFSPETKSPISLLEGFWRKGNVDIVCEKYFIPNFDNWDKLINFVINKIEF